MKTIKEIAIMMKAATSRKGTAYTLRIPAPEKDFAKSSGAKWNNDKKVFEIYTNDLDTHPLKHLLTTNEAWVALKHNIPFDYKAAFKTAGVVSDKVDDKWVDYVLVTEKYMELVEALTDAELL